MSDFEFKDKYSIDSLLEIMEILRKECPWDKEQSHSSIRTNFIEEVYEVIEAIDNNDTPLLREELGDVLLQVVFHAQIEKEQGNFTFDDVCDEICKKLIERHPHVFGEVNVTNTGQVLENWENIKNRTKKRNTATDTLDCVAKSLPALMYAQKIGKKASDYGMDFPNVPQTLVAVKNELNELEQAINLNAEIKDIEDEIGDLLFSCVNVARHLKIDGETALKKSAEKFIARFAVCEEITRQNGIDMKSLCIDELNQLWLEAKRKIGGEKHDKVKSGRQSEDFYRTQEN
jgi:tetrapyrrole methylase family protein/MazG family protein